MSSSYSQVSPTKEQSSDRSEFTSNLSLPCSAMSPLNRGKPNIS
jgi:hypothetical protein